MTRHAGSGPIVRLEAIRKVYNAGTAIETEVLHGISMEIGRGDFSALIGPSGSGKSTLLNIIGLLESPSSGSYLFDGRSIETGDDAFTTRTRLDSIGFVFQFHHLIPSFSALENVAMPALIREGRISAESRRRASELLDSVGLKDAADKRPAQLSGGMQQRVAIARALMHAPGLVLADEPTGNLDTRSSQGVFELLRRFNVEHGTSFLIVTHDARIAQRCDRTFELIDGQLVPESSVEMR